MSNHPRPVLLGYVRADLLGDPTRLPGAEELLRTFAAREEFTLGTIFVERGTAPAAFQTLMAEVSRNEAAWGVVVPDLRHVTVVEQLVLTGHEHGGRTPVLDAGFGPRAGGPGAGSRIRVGSAVPEPGSA